MGKYDCNAMIPTFWANLEKIPNDMYGHYRYVKGDIPSARFVILFNLYKTARISYSKSLYDSKEDCFAECFELDEMYKNHSIPTIKEYKWNGVYPKNRHTYPEYDFDNKSWWGYIVLDFELKQIIRVGGYGFMTETSFSITNQKSVKGIFKMKGANIPEIRDYFFRDVDIVPDDYKWDTGEYKGWLQFRWGDGKNAIGYIEPENERPGVDEIREFYDDATDSYVKRKVRVVYVDWDAPLPKKEKGIIYEYPNKEPVVFPGDFGYNGDLNINPWSLAEEIAHSEYNENIKESKSSIGDMLGDGNPLLKLKFD